MRRSSLAALGTLLLPVIALAATYEPADRDLYTDTNNVDRSTSIAINFLTDEGILEGNPDGTFRPDARVNRAEFVKTVMGLLDEEFTDNRSCFPDVQPNEWYTPYVCEAKQLGIVRGNALPDLTTAKYPFVPTRNVNYAEAIKMLFELYAYAHPTSGEWYEGYLAAAEERDLELVGMRASDFLTRGEVARLVAGFLAESRGELDTLRDAEMMSSFSSRSSSSRTSSSSSRMSSSSSRSSSLSGVSDPLTDTSVRSQPVLLGRTSAMVGAVTFFSNDEPVNVESITVTLTADASSTVRSFLLYDENRRLIGRASLDNSSSNDRTYIANLADGVLTLPRRDDVSIYARAELASRDDGGVSGASIEIDDVTVNGTGEWSNDAYQENSTGTFQAFQAVRSRIASVRNAGTPTGNFVSGPDQIIGSFIFTGETADAGSSAALTQIVFNLSKSGNVSLSNVELGVSGYTPRISCTSSATQITCSGIPDIYGSLRDGPKTLQVVADVTITDSNSAFLTVGISNPGTIGSAGDVTYTDASGTFTWLGVDSPVVQGTNFSR